MRIGARTRTFALLGNPVAHSLSPMMHNAGFLAAGVDAVYVVLRTEAGDVPALMHSLVVAGGGGNVTVPFKQVALNAAATRTARVDALRSANVFAGHDGGLHLANTDVDGIVEAVRTLRTTPRHWCIVGTGGSARAVAGAALEVGASVAVRSRSVESRHTFEQWAAALGLVVDSDRVADLVVNATPLGMHDDDALPLDLTALPSGAAMIDLVYRARGTTPWIAAGRTVGRDAVDGRAILLAQGVACWPIWFPGVPAPRDIMRAALNGSLG